MNEVKKCRKRLTESSGGACFLAFLAMAVSAVGLALELWGTWGYNRFNDDSRDYIFAGNAFNYIFTYDKSIITFVFSLVVFCITAANRRRKRIGGEMPAFVIMMSAAISVSPAAFIVYAFSNSEVIDVFSAGSDSEVFRVVMGVLVYALPLLACLLLMICGIVIAFKLVGENYTASVPIVKAVAINSEDKLTDAIAEDSTKSDNVIYEKNNNTITADKLDSLLTDGGDQDAVPASIEAEPTICHACGETVRPGAKFCQKCGAKMV